jgi:hypothetical protein
MTTMLKKDLLRLLVASAALEELQQSCPSEAARRARRAVEEVAAEVAESSASAPMADRWQQQNGSTLREDCLHG